MEQRYVVIFESEDGSVIDFNFKTRGTLQQAIVKANTEINNDEPKRKDGSYMWQAIGALCMASRREGLDWLLWNPHVSRRSLMLYYLHKGVGEVLSAAAPDLPKIDVCGTKDLRLWQAGILRAYYGVNRGRLRVGPVR